MPYPRVVFNGSPLTAQRCPGICSWQRRAETNCSPLDIAKSEQWGQDKPNMICLLFVTDTRRAIPIPSSPEPHPSGGTQCRQT